MPFLRQSTAQTIRFGPCLDKTDGVTEETALTLAQADMRLSKDGGAFAQKSAAGNATHDSDGWYSTSLSTTDTATVGELILNVHQPANMLPVWICWWVLEEEVYDDLFGASAVGYLKPTTAGRDLDVSTGGEAGIDWANIGSPTTAVDLSGTDIQLCDTVTTNTDMRGTDSALLAASAPTNFGDLAITVTTGLVDINDKTGFGIAVGGIASTAFAAAAIDAAAIAANAIGASELATDAVNEIVDQMWNEVRTDHATAGTFGESFQGVVDGAAEAGTLSTTQMTTDLSEATDDHYNGSTCIWLTGVLAGQRTNITDYAGATGLLTYTAVTEAPSATDRFILI